MASIRPFQEEDFMCPVCRSVFSDPVVLPCGHSGCKMCIENYWRVKGSRECPLCRKVSINNPHVNTSLRNLCQAFLDYKRHLEEHCTVHQENLSLYCCDDEQLVCERCRDSEAHRHHTCRPVCEVAEERKGVCRSQLDLVRRNMKITQNAHGYCYTKTDDIKSSAKLTESLIKRNFEMLHQQLNFEEEAMIEDLQLEQEEKLEIIKEELQQINEDISSLSSTIRDLEQTLESSDVGFLQTFKDNLKRVTGIPQESEVSPEELINHANYIGNLKFNVWRKIRNSVSYSPVVLDPNTVNCQLLLSDDLTEVWNPNEAVDEIENLTIVSRSQNLDRFNNYSCVLGTVGFSTGIHSWDVGVAKNNVWLVGVATESVQRRGKYGRPSDIWTIGFKSNTLSVRSPQESHVHLSGYEKPKKVRVNLDMSEGQVSFSDPQSDVVYYTFTHNFREKVFPFFHTMCREPLRVLPVCSCFRFLT